MYLTAGQFKGYKIITAKSARPTLSKVRESVFNMLSNLDVGVYFLDMFAGSAIMGLEALSRGYIVKEIEINPKTASIIKKNYEKLRARADISICDALKYVDFKKYDVIYVDPPWNSDYSPIISKAASLLNDNGVIVVEYDEKSEIDISKLALLHNLEVIKSKKYGRALVIILRNITK